jgi:hypothetical protein
MKFQQLLNYNPENKSWRSDNNTDKLISVYSVTKLLWDGQGYMKLELLVGKLAWLFSVLDNVEINKGDWVLDTDQRIF